MVRTGLVSALLVGVSGTAMASGFALRENSATTMGTGCAGMCSRADDLSIIFNNPAGMTHLSGNQAQATGTLIVPSMQYKGGGTSLMGTVPTGGSDGTDAGGPAGAPAAYGF